MKRLLLYLLTVVSIVACSKSEPADNGSDNGGGNTPTTPTITLNKSSVSFDEFADEESISFSATADWIAEIVNDRADGWLSVTPQRGTAGDASITIKAKDNDTPDERNASVRIKAGTASKTIAVSQKQKDALTVTSSKFEVTSLGGEVKIEVKANIDFEYAIDESAKKWIKYEGTRAMKTSTLTFSVAENDETEKREGKITIKSGEFNEVVTVYQSGYEPTIVISQNEYVVSSDGETIAVEVTSNVDVAMEMPTDVDWISENTTRATSTSTYYFDIQQNEDYDQRTAEIKFTNKENGLSETVKVVQTQKDAIVLAKAEYEFGVDGGNLDFEIQTNVDITVTISDNAKDWIQQVETRALVTKALFFDIAVCEEEEDREGTITISGGNATQTITVKQSGLKEILEMEREALIAFYNATGGDNWTRNDNWCSDKPVREWYGIITNEYGRVCMLNIPSKNLSGSIPAELGNLSSLKQLDLENNQLSGSIPAELGNLSTIEVLDLSKNQLTGSIPAELGNLSSLINLYLQGNQLTGSIPAELGNLSTIEVLNLSENQLTGSIPAEIVRLTNLETMSLCWNYLTGELPSGIDKMNIWTTMWPNIIEQNADNGKTLSIEGVTIPAPEFSATTIDGAAISDAIYAENEYTVLFNFADWCGYSREFTHILLDIYDRYKDKGVEVLCYTTDYEMSETDMDSYRDEYELPWHCFICKKKSNKTLYQISLTITSSALLGFPQINVVDKEGNIVFNRSTNSRYNLANFFEDKLGPVEQDKYTSTDYSRDGEITTLQTATRGNGIDIVLMGDGYSDRLIADGTYDQVMDTAMEKFFMEEPYKSHRDYFNVYSITAVSKNEIYTDTSETAFAGYFGGGSLVGGNDVRVFSYAEKAVGAERMNDALIVVMMNSEAYAGTCYMYYAYDGDWGNGASISYFPIGVDDTALAQVLHHEAAGHGFSKLADEYAYEYMGAIPDTEISAIKNYEQYGWYKNVDFTNDPAKVKWAHFLTDARYANDGLGVYEGAYTYWTGVWRPTDNSIMSYNTGGFNAPSREAIYYRIHKLAYGADWKYDYEEFVEWDAKNRKTAAATRGVPYRLDIPEDFEPLHPPVVMNTSWCNAKNNAPTKNATRSTGGNAGRNLQKSASVTSHTTSKPITASTSITLPDGTVRKTMIGSNRTTMVEYKKANK